MRFVPNPAKEAELYERLARLERAFEALLEDVASNPHTAVEMARSYLNQES